MVPKSHLFGLQKRVEDLERALGRKALEVDVSKKPSHSRDSNYLSGHKVAGMDDGLFIDDGMSGAGQTAKLALRSAAVRTGMAGEATGRGNGAQPAREDQSGILWVRRLHALLKRRG